MKRLLIASALCTFLGGVAFAQSQGDDPNRDAMIKAYATINSLQKACHYTLKDDAVMAQLGRTGMANPENVKRLQIEMSNQRTQSSAAPSSKDCETMRGLADDLGMIEK